MRLLSKTYADEFLPSSAASAQVMQILDRRQQREREALADLEAKKRDSGGQMNNVIERVVKDRLRCRTIRFLDSRVRSSFGSGCPT